MPVVMLNWTKMKFTNGNNKKIICGENYKDANRFTFQY
ncbi:hypothetical protein EDD66_11559 [Mobilisporobacter senegalensis]|uniref:Uncharacterized protein n=1 Tax=Mobilisporobacter senegalensis TaxID=1329262 RepID=A0A3N1X6F2_9FIRM|nr:hypothetical protein EDD66_11559 [Mobilisporobacter senegalensis]